MKLSTDEIRKITDRLCTYLEESGRSEIKLKGDYYWVADFEQLQALDLEPSEFSMGQLTDDLNELTRIVDGESPPVGHAFVWLGHVLVFLGNQNRC